MFLGILFFQFSFLIEQFSPQILQFRKIRVSTFKFWSLKRKLNNFNYAKFIKVLIGIRVFICDRGM